MVEKLVKRGGLAILLLLVGFSSARAQQDIDLIDTPTARILNKNQYSINFRFFQDGGVLVTGKAGLTENFTIGASYGGKQVIGMGNFEGNPQPTFSLKYKLAEQGEKMPVSLAVGYDGQGYGTYYKEGDKIEIDGGAKIIKDGVGFYQTSSPGFFLSASEKIEKFYVHGGINHSLENDPGKSGISFFLGVDVQLTPQIVGKLEYNDLFHGEIKYSDIFKSPSDKVYRHSGGELNIGLKWQYTPEFSLEFDFRDITQRYRSSGNRIFQINYCGEF